MFSFAALFSLLLTSCERTDLFAAKNAETVYCQEGITITAQYKEKSPFRDAGLLLLVQNDTGRELVVRCCGLWINGYRLDLKFGCKVYGWMQGCANIGIPKKSLKERRIACVKTLSFVLEMEDARTRELMDRTEKIYLIHPEKEIEPAMQPARAFKISGDSKRTNLFEQIV